MTRKRIIVALIMVGVILVSTLVGWLIYKGVNSATINIYFAPKSATMKIGDNSARFGDNYVRPGTYKVTITKEGFTSYSKEVTVKSGETVHVEGSLSPTSDATKDWYSNNAEDYAIAQYVSDKRADEARQYLVKQYPIVSILPLIGSYSSYRVDYGVSPTRANEYAIYVRYQSEAAKQQALQAVKAKGYDLSKYEVIYKFDAPTDGSTTFIGTVALSDRGIASDALSKVQSVLSEKYPNSTVTFADSADHTVSDDGTVHTYSVGCSINGNGEQPLTITITTMTDIQVKLSGETLYTGAID